MCFRLLGFGLLGKMPKRGSLLATRFATASMVDSKSSWVAAGFRWLNQQQHQTPEEVRGKPTEHSLGEEGRVLHKRLENPLVFERLHVVESRGASRKVNPSGRTVVCART